MKCLVRTSKPYKWEAARFGVRVYFYSTNVCFQFDVWRSVTEVIFYRKVKTNV